jgi:hypothetical protein
MKFLKLLLCVAYSVRPSMNHDTLPWTAFEFVVDVSIRQPPLVLGFAPKMRRLHGFTHFIASEANANVAPATTNVPIFFPTFFPKPKPIEPRFLIILRSPPAQIRLHHLLLRNTLHPLIQEWPLVNDPATLLPLLKIEYLPLQMLLLHTLQLDTTLTA